MKDRTIVLFLIIAFVLCNGLTIANGFKRQRNEYESESAQGTPESLKQTGYEPEEPEYEPEKEEYGGYGDYEEKERFLLEDSKQVVSTDAGEMRVVRSSGGVHGGGRGGGYRRRMFVEWPMHIGFITMEPRSLFVPQYLDSSLILFVKRGEAKVGFIYKDKLAERRLRMGDIYQIPAGSAFYLVNVGEGQRLHVICSIDPSESLGFSTFQSFFIGGGTYSRSILDGFDRETLSIAFNVTVEELREIMTSQVQGPIIYINDTRAPYAPSVWTKFLKLKEEDKIKNLKRMVESQPVYTEEEKEQISWSWRRIRKIVSDFVFGEGNKKDETPGKSPDSYNLYGKKADYRSAYGWSIALDDHDYPPLRHSGIGIYLVNLTAGSMMAPHLNPTATEYGIVLRGSGRIQIVYPNGTRAVNTKVGEGDVFRIPRYFPFCQIASRTGPFEFFGFTTSAYRNRPQFLAGASSILRTLRGPELATAFGTDNETLRLFLDAQHEAIILPSTPVSPPDETTRKEKDKEKGKKKKGLEMMSTPVSPPDETTRKEKDKEKGKKKKGLEMMGFE